MHSNLDRGFVMKYLKEYLHFVKIRQETFLEKLKNPNYTHPELGTMKFTNVHRVLDRTSQYELREVILGENLSQEPLETLFRIFLFNQFKTETFWDLVKNNSLVTSLKSFSSGALIAHNVCYQQDKKNGDPKLFTSAYVVPGAKGESKVTTIAKRCINFIERIDKIKKAYNLDNLQNIYDQLKLIPGIGQFLASQVLFDFFWVNAGDLAILGTGAIRGAYKLGLISSPSGVTSNESFLVLCRCAKEIRNAGLDKLITANGKPVPLEFGDIQNTLCEFDKIMRVWHPNVVAGKSAPTKIKNVYKPGTAIDYVVPGAWVDSKEKFVRIDGR